MASSNSDDLILDGGQLSCQVKVQRGGVTRKFQVDAYPTKHTRDITNNKDATKTLDSKVAKQCRWFTVGIIQFHVNSKTHKIYKLRKDSNELQITLEHCWDEIIKKELAKRAKELYELEFTPDNFEIYPFKAFIAKLKITLDGTRKEYFGTLFNSRELYPIRVNFPIDDCDDLSKIALKLDKPNQHDITLIYEYSLSGITATHASFKVSADQVNNIELVERLFSHSQANEVLVSRSYLEELAVEIDHKLTVTETIGVGASSFGHDLIKQEITSAIAANGFKKYSMEDIEQMKNRGILIFEDLKADKITSVTEKKEQQSKSSDQNSTQSSVAESLENSEQESSKKHEKDAKSEKSSHNISAKIDTPKLLKISAEGNYNTASERTSDRERSNSSSEQHQEKKSSESSKRSENSGSSETSNSFESQFQGDIRRVKNIEAVIIHKNTIRSGFTVSMSRWQQHVAEKSEKSTLTTEDDIATQEDFEIKLTQQTESFEEAKQETIGTQVISRITNHTQWKQHGITVAGGNGFGDKLNELKHPNGISIDNDQQSIYIADSDNHRIVEWKFNEKTGQVIAGGNGKGNQMNQLCCPTDVLVDTKNNSLIICDSRNTRVVEWSRQNGIKNRQILISDIYCCGITMDKNGYIYVSDCEKNEVRRWKRGETNGTIVAGGNGRGEKLNQLYIPTYLFVDQDDSVYISDTYNHRVMKWIKNAKEGIIVAGGQGEGNQLTQLNGPSGIIVDHLDNVYVADSGNNRIMCWSKESKRGRIIVGGNGEGEQPHQLNNSTGISFDREDNLYVVEFGNDRVQKFEIDKY